MMGLAFIATQFINLIAMSYSYGAFTFDHIISVVACLLIGLSIFMLRYNKRFQIYAMAYSALILVATMSSAMNQNTGINSALIPFFILGVVVNGFICGWRATCAFGGIVLIGIWYLWFLIEIFNAPCKLAWRRFLSPLWEPFFRVVWMRLLKN